jgi:hypothetical protein
VRRASMGHDGFLHLIGGYPYLLGLFRWQGVSDNCSSQRLYRALRMGNIRTVYQVGTCSYSLLKLMAWSTILVWCTTFFQTGGFYLGPCYQDGGLQQKKSNDKLKHQ